MGSSHSLKKHLKDESLSGLTSIYGVYKTNVIFFEFLNVRVLTIMLDTVSSQHRPHHFSSDDQQRN